MKLPICAFIITLNEQDNLRKCLESLDFCAEIVIVDSGSTDNTLEIAEEFGAKIFHRKFDNYCQQKQFALEQCGLSWVFSIDADERVSPQLKALLQELDLSQNQIQGYYLPRLHWYAGKWLRHGGLYPDSKLRLFRKEHGCFVGDGVHEVVRVQGKTKHLKAPIYHYSWKNFSDMLKRQLRYAELVAKARFQLGRNANLSEAFFKATFTFLHRYVLRMGFLDGWQGLQVSYAWAFASAHKIFILHELNQIGQSEISIFSSYRCGGFCGFLLYPVQKVYATIVWLRNALYDLAWLKSRCVDTPVISVGNLSLGGSGKTPFTILIAKLFHQAGLGSGVVLTRGYGGKGIFPSPHLVEDQDEVIQIGDEAKLLHNAGKIYDLKVLVFKDRYQGALYAEKTLQPKYLLIDDGFQHRALARDLNICLIDCSDVGCLELFPTGSLREGFAGLKRAEMVILSRTKLRPLLTQKIKDLVQSQTDAPIYDVIEHFSFSHDGLDLTFEELLRHKLYAFCALGNSLQFFMALQGLGLKLSGQKAFPDHHIYCSEDLSLINRLMSEAEADYCLTTAKDLVKIPADSDLYSKIILCQQELSLPKPCQEQLIVQVK